MEESVVLMCEARDGAGKGNSRRLRADGKLPGNLYTEGKDAASLTLDRHQVHLWLRSHRGESLLVDLEVAGDKKRVLLKEVQHHPVTDALLHVDFYEIDPNRRIRVRIPLNITGTPVGVSQGGGTTDYLIRSLDLDCLPGDVIEEFTLDIAHLEIGDIVTVADVEIDREKYHVHTADEIGVASVAAPRISGKDLDDESGAADGEGEEEGGEEGGE